MLMFSCYLSTALGINSRYVGGSNKRVSVASLLWPESAEFLTSNPQHWAWNGLFTLWTSPQSV